MIDYASSGVNLERAAAAKKRIAAAARTTFGPRVLSDVGHFGGFFALGDEGSSQVLVASADGVGTKLLLGIKLRRLAGLGTDLVQHCINDILVCGAKPLFFLDYMAFGQLDPEVAATIAESLAAGCRANGVALIGGETAEMPGLYEPGHFDLAGTIVGTVRRDQILDGSRVKSGDVMLALPSTGLHTNGYSLVRKILAREIENGSLESEKLSDGRSLGEALLESHRCYLNSVGDLLTHPALHALSHITGGGIEENTRRVLPEGLNLEVDWHAWDVPELFVLLQQRGKVTDEEMRHVFNLGIGLIAILDSDLAADFSHSLEARGESPFVIGKVV